MKQGLCIVLLLIVLMIFTACQTKQPSDFQTPPDTQPTGAVKPSQKVNFCTYGHAFSENGGVCDNCGIDYFSATLAFVPSKKGDHYIVTGIGSCKASRIVIPETYKGLPVTEIGNKAFENCEQLVALELHEGITKLGDEMLDGCSNLESIRIPSKVTQIGARFARRCTALKTVEFAGTITSIGEYAFARCSNLQTIHLNDGLISLGSYAFYECSALESVHLGNGLTVIPDKAFCRCSLLQNVTLPESLKEIQAGAFALCTGLENISIPSGIENVHSTAFDRRGSLQYTVYEGMGYLGNASNPFLVLACRMDDSVKKVVTHEQTKVVSGCVFKDHDIISLSLGKNVAHIDQNQLMRNIYMEKVDIDPENKTFRFVDNCLIHIETKTLIAIFYGYIIPDDGSVTSLGRFTLSTHVNNTYLIPGCITEIQENAFGNGILYYSTAVIYFAGTEDMWKKIDISDTGNNLLKILDILFYSETEPTEPGNYWHYVDGVPTPWETED